MLKKPPKLKSLPTIKGLRRTKPATPSRSGPSVTGHSYDADKKLLTVTFHHGKTYRYQDVPQAVADGFRTAPSQGKFLHSEIIGKFKIGEQP